MAASEDFYTPETPDDLYSDVIRELDWSVGPVFAKLRDSGLDENTFVFFTSDNGATLGGYNGSLRGMRGANFDGGVRVPAIARWPGTIPPGQVSAEVTSSIDIFPTIVSAAGAALPGDRVIDGRDILPLLDGRVRQSRHEAVFATGGESLRMIRSQRWKLHGRAPRPSFRCLHDASGWKDPRGPDGITIIAQFEQANPTLGPGIQTGAAPKPLMLFDMQNDRAEHPEVVARLQAIFERVDAEAPDEFPGGSRSPKLLWLRGGELRYDRVIQPLPVE